RREEAHPLLEREVRRTRDHIAGRGGRIGGALVDVGWRADRSVPDGFNGCAGLALGSGGGRHGASLSDDSGSSVGVSGSSAGGSSGSSCGGSGSRTKISGPASAGRAIAASQNRGSVQTRVPRKVTPAWIAND